MKKVLSVMILVSVMFITVPVQAESNVDVDNFKETILPLSFWFSGVVEVSTYLSVREQPSSNAREVMRLYNGDRLEIKMGVGNASGWWEVYGVNGRSYNNRIGYVSRRYVRAWQ